MVKLGIVGSHQRQNAALARAAALELRRLGHRIDDGAITLGLRRVRWPARFEIVRGRPTVVLDGAHTKESTAALAATLRRTFPGRRIRLVFGCTSDRDPSAVAGPLLRLAASVHATSAGPRAMPAQQVAAALGASSSHARIRDALAEARDAASARDIVCVTGSMALVGGARAAMGLEIPERLW